MRVSTLATGFVVAIGAVFADVVDVIMINHCPPSLSQERFISYYSAS